jgi:hypothetical protein
MQALARFFERVELGDGMRDPGTPTELRGVDAVVEETMVLGRQAVLAEPALIDGSVGIVVAPRGRLLFALVLPSATAGKRLRRHRHPGAAGPTVHHIARLRAHQLNDGGKRLHRPGIIRWGGILCRDGH